MMAVMEGQVAAFAAIDFETANHDRASACALGVAIVQGGQITTVERHLIQPPTRDFVFTYIHGLTWEDVRRQPRFPEVWDKVSRRLPAVDFLAAHNAAFDRGVLNACCGRYGLRASSRFFVCTVAVARSVWGIYPTRLPDVCQHLHIGLKHHEAGSDAEACARIVLAATKCGWAPPGH